MLICVCAGAWSSSTNSLLSFRSTRLSLVVGEVLIPGASREATDDWRQAG